MECVLLSSLSRLFSLFFFIGLHRICVYFVCIVPHADLPDNLFLKLDFRHDAFPATFDWTKLNFMLPVF